MNEPLHVNEPLFLNAYIFAKTIQFIVTLQFILNMQVQYKYIIYASISGCIAVLLGALGSHAFKSLLNQNGYYEVYQTANRYHFYHTFALALLSMLPRKNYTRWAGIGFTVGLVFFSGSLYGLALSGWRALGIITPLGGVLWMISWMLTAFAAYSACHTHISENSSI